MSIELIREVRKRQQWPPEFMMMRARRLSFVCYTVLAHYVSFQVWSGQMVGEPVGTVIKSDTISISDHLAVLAELSVLDLNKSVVGMNARAEFNIYLVSKGNGARTTLFHPSARVFDNRTKAARSVQIPPNIYDAAIFGDKLQIHLGDSTLLRFERQTSGWEFTGESQCGPGNGWGGLGPIPKAKIIEWDRVELRYANGEVDVLKIDQNGVPWLNGKVYGWGMFGPWRRELWERSSSVDWPQSKKAQLYADKFRTYLRSYRLPRDENGVTIAEPEPLNLPGSQNASASRSEVPAPPEAATTNRGSEFHEAPINEISKEEQSPCRFTSRRIVVIGFFGVVLIILRWVILKLSGRKNGSRNGQQ